MGLPNDLTGNKVSQTYPKLVQNVSGSFYDGIGTPIPSVNITASYALSGLAFGNLDGGIPSTNYGGALSINGGTP